MAMLIDGVSYTVITPQPPSERDAERTRARQNYESAKQATEQASEQPDSRAVKPRAQQDVSVATDQPFVPPVASAPRSLSSSLSFSPERGSVAQVTVQRAISTYQQNQALDSMTAALDHDVLTGVDLYA